MDRQARPATEPQEQGSRLTWTVGIWAVAAVAAVALVLPRGRGTTDSVAPAEAPVPVSTLADRGYIAMRERQSNPAALERALAHFTRGNVLDPAHLDARFGLAWARQVKGLPESEWRQLYEGIVTDASLLAYLSLFNLAYAERRAGRQSEAAALLEQALRVMPQRADGWLQLGRTYEALGEHARALAPFQRAAALDSGSAEALYLLGQAHGRLGQRAEAEAAWSRVLQLDAGWKDRIEAARGSFSGE